MDDLIYDLAKRTVHTLQVREGSIVEIRGDPAAHDWAGAFSVAVEAVGGIPFQNLVSIQNFQERILKLPIEQLRVPPSFLFEMADRIHAVIVIERDWSQLQRTCPPERLAAWNEGMAVIVHRIESRRVPDCQIAHPNTVPDEFLLISRDSLRRNLMDALLADSREIVRRCGTLTAKLAQAGTIEILSGRNYRFRARLESRLVRASDGKLADDCCINFPFGSVYFVPVQSSGEGEIYFENWRTVKGLLLRFENGRLVDINADHDGEAFERLLNVHTGDKDRVSHIGIGVNPGMRVYSGHVAIDDCREGSVFVALGENRYMGGANNSTLNVDLVSQNATLSDSTGPLIQNGCLLPE